MAEHPLLIFPEPSRSERAKRQGFGPKFQLPDSKLQAQRPCPTVPPTARSYGAQTGFTAGQSHGHTARTGAGLRDSGFN